MSNWKRLNTATIKKRVFSAVQHNIDFFNESTLGVPGSHLDQKVFSSEAPFLKDAPFLYTMISNPNHIGCHTLGESESYFEGTHELEREVIRICAEDIFRGGPDEQDGYVASGGTEANIQALWIYRNYFLQEHQADLKEICVLCSADSHYSMAKGAAILHIDLHQAKVDYDSRKIEADQLRADVDHLKKAGKKYFIVICNMMTTMFGSVDQPHEYTQILEELRLSYKLHVDGAYGGFFYPFSCEQQTLLHFDNPVVSSITIDAHKMLQAPYGTGIFLARKGLMQYANTNSASYVKGLDATLVGSRSGANAVAVWMILAAYGKHGWFEKIQILLLRTNWLCQQLEEKGLSFYRNPYSNIVTIKASQIDPKVAQKYGLVPDDHLKPQWNKIVVMEHVTIDKLEPFIEEV